MAGKLPMRQPNQLPIPEDEVREGRNEVEAPVEAPDEAPVGPQVIILRVYGRVRGIGLVVRE